MFYNLRLCYFLRFFHLWCISILLRFEICSSSASLLLLWSRQIWPNLSTSKLRLYECWSHPDLILDMYPLFFLYFLFPSLSFVIFEYFYYLYLYFLYLYFIFLYIIICIIFPLRSSVSMRAGHTLILSWTCVLSFPSISLSFHHHFSFFVFLCIRVIHSQIKGIFYLCLFWWTIIIWGPKLLYQCKRVGPLNKGYLLSLSGLKWIMNAVRFCSLWRALSLQCSNLSNKCWFNSIEFIGLKFSSKNDLHIYHTCLWRLLHSEQSHIYV